MGVIRVFLLSLFVAGAAFAEPRVDLRFNELDRYIEQVMAETQLPGLAIGILHKGQLVHARGFGYRDVANRLPVTPDTLFAIGSTTKAMTATTVAMLADEGRIRFDQPVREYVPDFRLKDDYATAHTTMIDLMSHRTGVPRHDIAWWGYDNFPRSYFWERLQYLEPSKSFREFYQYNNFMFMAAGYIVERLTGDSWETFMRRRLFSPLGMVRSNFSVEEMERSSDFARPYSKFGSEVTQIPMRPIVAMGPAGSVNSSVNEMAQWLKFNLQKGQWNGTELVKPQSFAMLMRSHTTTTGDLPFPEFSAGTYGLGWQRLHFRGKDLTWHTGGIDGFLTFVGVMPGEELGVVVFQNSDFSPAFLGIAFRALDTMITDSPADWHKRIMDLIAQKQSAVETTPTPSEVPLIRPAQDYLGFFSHNAYGEIELAIEDAHLVMAFHGMRFNLKHIGNGTFLPSSDNPQINEFTSGVDPIFFQTDSTGAIVKVFIRFEPALGPIEFVKQ